MRRRVPQDSPDIPIAPMIDCVFLMLVYFMTTSSLQQSEADLPCPVGQAGGMADPLPAVDEQSLQVDAEGGLSWNGSPFDLGNMADCRLLVGRLESFRDTCEQAGSEAALRLLPEAKAPHQALVTLLDCITESGIEQIHFP